MKIFSQAANSKIYCSVHLDKDKRLHKNYNYHYDGLWSPSCHDHNDNYHFLGNPCDGRQYSDIEGRDEQADVRLWICQGCVLNTTIVIILWLLLNSIKIIWVLIISDGLWFRLYITSLIFQFIEHIIPNPLEKQPDIFLSSLRSQLSTWRLRWICWEIFVRSLAFCCWEH